jgi:hypothetical protein
VDVLEEEGELKKKMLVSAVAALLFSVGSAHADDHPPLREGLWSNHTETTAIPGNKTTEKRETVCRNHAYDEYARAQIKRSLGYRLSNESLNGATFTSDMRCRIEGGAADFKVTAIYGRDTAVHSVASVAYSPSVGGMSSQTITVVQNYIGSCPAGMRPGDTKGADGRITNDWKH